MKQCPFCHAAGENQDVFCKYCGSRYPETQNMPPVYDFNTPVYISKTDGMAVASLVLGIISVIFACFDGLGIFPGIVGLVLGIISKSRISKSCGSIGGDGMALAGIIMSALAILIAIGFIVFLIFTILLASHTVGPYSGIYSEAFRPVFSFA